MIIQQNLFLDSMFRKAKELSIEHYYIGGGCITQSVWNHLLEFPLNHGINDIKNQARVHLWYEQSFGYAITPYTSLEEAINTWPTTATAVGIRMTADEKWKIYAPFGLNDLSGFIIRANKVQITKEIYDKKVERWTRNPLTGCKPQKSRQRRRQVAFFTE